MHPPPFNVTLRLSNWSDCSLELRCPCLPCVIMLPMRLLLKREDRTFGAVTAVLQCSACGGKPAPVYLVAGHSRSFSYVPPPDWSVELVATSPGSAMQ